MIRNNTEDEFCLLLCNRVHPDFKELHDMGLDDCVEFTGRVPDHQMLEYLNTVDVCVNSDKYNSMDDKSTMNTLLHDPERRKKMGEYGCDWVVNELSWEHTSKALLDGYEKFFTGKFE